MEPLLEALEAARRFPGIVDAVLFGTALHLTLPAEDPARLRRDFEAAGITVHSVRAIPPTLEDVFIDRLSRADGPAAGADHKEHV